MANSSRGVMKLPAEKLDSYPAITAHTEKQGVPYETLAQFQGVQQLDKLDDQNALMLVADGGDHDATNGCASISVLLTSTSILALPFARF